MSVWQPWNFIFLIGFVLYVGIRGRFAHRTKENSIVESNVDIGEKILLLLVVVSSLPLPLLYLFTPLLTFADYGLPVWLPWLGATLMVVALWLFWRSHVDLGLNWSVTLEVREGHRVVREGVYQRIRHPMYSAIWLWTLAQGMLLENWLAGWAAAMAFGCMYVIRTPREEEMLRAHFGAEYESYMAETGRLVPRLSAPEKS